MEDDTVSESHIASSQDDDSRRELLWNSKIELLIRNWRESCTKLASLHDKCSSRKKLFFYWLAMSCSILPFCTALVSEILPPGPQIQTINTIILFISSSLSAFNAFLNYGKAYAEHNHASFKYTELVHEIDSILVKPKADRVQADLQLEIIKNRFELLNKTCIDL